MTKVYPCWNIFHHTRRIYSVKDIVHLLLFPDLQKSGFVCSKVPTSIHQSVSFIVNLGQLDSPKDVLADDMGVWRHNGVDNSACVCNIQ